MSFPWWLGILEAGAGRLNLPSGGFNLAGGEGSHARDNSSELLTRMMLGKMFKYNGFRKYIDRGGTGF